MNNEKQPLCFNKTESLFDDKLDNICIICFEPIEKKYSFTDTCEHTFHKKCIEDWAKLQNTCPVCRKELTYSSWALTFHRNMPTKKEIIRCSSIVCGFLIFIPTLLYINSFENNNEFNNNTIYYDDDAFPDYKTDSMMRLF